MWKQVLQNTDTALASQYQARPAAGRAFYSETKSNYVKRKRPNKKKGCKEKFTHTTNKKKQTMAALQFSFMNDAELFPRMTDEINHKLRKNKGRKQRCQILRF